MSEHTKEPWKVNDQRHSGWLNNAMLICGPEGHNIVRCYSDYHNEEANARRIVACVNACKDVDNETLEKIASGDMDGSEIFELSKVKQQRDMLAEALDWAIRFIDTYAKKQSGPATPELNKARAALAKHRQPAEDTKIQYGCHCDLPEEYKPDEIAALEKRLAEANDYIRYTADKGTRFLGKHEEAVRFAMQESTHD